MRGQRLCFPPAYLAPAPQRLGHRNAGEFAGLLGCDRLGCIGAATERRLLRIVHLGHEPIGVVGWPGRSPGDHDEAAHDDAAVPGAFDTLGFGGQCAFPAGLNPLKGLDRFGGQLERPLLH